MKSKTLKSLVIVLIFILCFSISSIVLASSFNAEIEIDKDNQNSNEIVLVLKIKDINFEENISTIEGNLEFDKSVFEEIKIENLNDWSIVYNDQENANGKFLGFKISDEKIKQEDLCKITLRLSEKIEASNTQISLKNVKSADGDKLVNAEDKTINVDFENNSVKDIKVEKDSINKKGLLKYVLILVIIVLITTICTSTSYLIQKYKLKNKYNSKK